MGEIKNFIFTGKHFKIEGRPDILTIDGEEFYVLDIKTVGDTTDLSVIKKPAHHNRHTVLIGFSGIVSLNYAERVEELIKLECSKLNDNIISAEKYFEEMYYKREYNREFEEEKAELKKELNYRARQQQWKGKQFIKYKNNRRQNRIAYNHGKHRKR